MGGDDELCVLGDHVRDHRHQRELALRAERRLRLVQQVEPARDEPRLEEAEEALTMRVRVEVNPVATLHVGERRPRGTHRQPLRERGPVGVLVLELVDPRQQLASHHRQPLCEAEEVLRPQEEAARGPAAPHEPQCIAQHPLRAKGRVRVEVGAPDYRQPRRRRDPLQQRRLPRAVLPDEEGHRARQLEGRDSERITGTLNGNRPSSAPPFRPTERRNGAPPSTLGLERVLSVDPARFGTRNPVSRALSHAIGPTSGAGSFRAMLPTRDETLALVHEYTASDSLRKHMLAVEAAMRAYAEKFGEDVERWGLTGLVHDFDYERFPNAAQSPTEEHPSEGVRILRARGWPDDVLEAILGHGNYTGVPRVSRLAKTLYAVDELTGLITATALVRPSRSVHEVDARSVRKKMKDKAFARGVNRDDVVQGAADLGVDLDEHIDFVIGAMRGAADSLGLAGVPVAG